MHTHTHTHTYIYNQAIQALIYHGASANECDKNLATPLHLAAIQGDTQVIQTLLESGADPTLLNIWNRSCIHRAMFYGRQTAMDMMLRVAGDKYDDTELMDTARLEPMSEQRIEELRKLDDS
jgi:ankyrin repeat protein